MVVPPIKIVQKHQEIASEHPNDNCDGNQALFIDTKSRFDNHFDLMRERETSFFKPLSQTIPETCTFLDQKGADFRELS